MKAKDTPGATKLRAICQASTISAVAAKAGVAEGALRHVLAGRRTPSRALRTALEVTYGIEPGAWRANAAAERARESIAAVRATLDDDAASEGSAGPLASDGDDLDDLDLDPDGPFDDSKWRLRRELDHLDTHPDADAFDLPWRDLLDLLDEVLEAHPAAARDWADALDARPKWNAEIARAAQATRDRALGADEVGGPHFAQRGGGDAAP